MTTLSNMRFEVAPGTGLVAHRDGCAVVLPGSVGSLAARALLEAVSEAAAGLESANLPRRLVAALTAMDPDEMPDFCIVAPSETRLVAILHGDIELVVSGPGDDLWLRGVESPTWLDRYLPEDIDLLRVGRSGQVPESAGSEFDLRAGTVPGAGLVLTARDVAAPEVAIADVSDEIAPAGPTGDAESLEVSVDPATGEAGSSEAYGAAAAAPLFETVDFGDTDLEERSPLPLAQAEGPPTAGEGDLVDGIRCIRGHFNDPRALWCSRCGISMVQATHNLTQDRRPALGILVFDDGQTFAVDASYIIGRDPTHDELVRTGSARPIVLDDPEQVVSRSHVQILPEEWDVTVIDRDSSNGTMTRLEGDDWVPLEPGESRRLVPGMDVRLGIGEGERVFAFHSHHRAQHQR